MAMTLSEPVRIQRQRVKGWKAPKGAVYVGRGSIWGNPFRIGDMWARRRMAAGGGQRSSGPIPDAAEAVRLYRRFTARETSLLLFLPQLRGKDLMCWCPLDQPCHADVLLKLANAATASPSASPARPSVPTALEPAPSS